MTKDRRHYENEGAQAAIKGIRGRVNTLGRKGILDRQAVLAVRGAINDMIAEVSERKGGLGRK